MTTPDDMRAAMADYIRTVHQAYLSQSAGQPPAVRGRLPLLAGPFTVIAAGVRNLHVVATTEPLPPPSGPEVALPDRLGELSWTVRFYDPVVLPPLGMIDESTGPASAQVRRTLGVSTYLYHLIVQPGSELTGHHAGHAGAGLAMSHVAEARDFEAIRVRARGREPLVDEMEGAALAGLVRAQALLAREIAPADDTVAALVAGGTPEPSAVRRAVLAAVRRDAAPGAAEPAGGDLPG
ncbi:MAG TPA: hypothetical protein VK923_18465 [Euzebyales bacterium]|nr:hypothetical protein [Euzebyales bacterium]